MTSMTNVYPISAGWKEPTTSRENAEHLEQSGRAPSLRNRVLALFDRGWEGTADAAADLLDEHPFAIRPRLSELHKQGFLERTVTRGQSSLKNTCWIWKRAGVPFR